jgi:putative restriction endonuclease
MLKYSEIQRLLVKKGFKLVAENTKIIELRSSYFDYPVYLNKTAGGSPSTIVLHPQFESSRTRLFAVPGVKTNGDHWYHNSNMRLFPKRMHTGETPGGFGIAFGVESEQALDNLFGIMQGADSSATDPFMDVAGAERELSECDATTRETLIKARIGQGQFRARLIEYWRNCAVTGCDFIAILVASHIKPWRDSTNIERLDPFNGLLLTPNLDQAFDQGYISFKDDGEVIISSRLSASTQQALGLAPDFKLRSVNARHLPFLHWHRSRLFLE